MPRVDIFPFNAQSMDDRGVRFTRLTATVDEAQPAKDGQTKDGRDYHLPPRVSFMEDNDREDWMWKEWDEAEGGFKDYDGELPASGATVEVVLKAAYKGGEGSGEYYRDVHTLKVLNGAVASTPQPTGEGAAAPAPQSGSTSALGRLSTQEQIAATAMSNVLLPLVWAAEPDGDEWKELIRAAVKKIGQAQVPPSLMQIAKSEAEKASPPAQATSAPDADDLTNEPEEDVEELPW